MPTGGYFIHDTISAACSAVSTHGIMIPSAPASSAVETRSFRCPATRTNVVMPLRRATAIDARTSSRDQPVCSRSRRIQSCPARAQIAPIPGVANSRVNRPTCGAPVRRASLNVVVMLSL